MTPFDAFMAAMADAALQDDFRAWNEIRAVFADWLEENDHPWAGMARAPCSVERGFLVFVLPWDHKARPGLVNSTRLFHWDKGRLYCRGCFLRDGGIDGGIHVEFLTTDRDLSGERPVRDFAEWFR